MLFFRNTISGMIAVTAAISFASPPAVAYLSESPVLLAQSAEIEGLDSEAPEEPAPGVWLRLFSALGIPILFLIVVSLSLKSFANLQKRALDAAADNTRAIRENTQALRDMLDKQA